MTQPQRSLSGNQIPISEPSNGAQVTNGAFLAVGTPVFTLAPPSVSWQITTAPAPIHRIGTRQNGASPTELGL
jgi:hypothetical protein